MSLAKMLPREKPAMRARRTGGRLLAAIVALAALVLVTSVWFWVSLVMISVPLLSWQNGVMAGGGIVFCLATLVAFGLEDLLEWIWAALAALAAIIVAAFWGILSLF